MARRLLITAGPTREMLDPVRFLSNLSTGEMGYALARAARKRKFRVTLISGPTSLHPPRGVKLVSVTSAQHLERVCRRLFPKHEMLIMTAAVCDFTAEQPHAHKIRRTRARHLRLKRTPDIVAGLARRKGRRVIVGFSLETEDWIRNAMRKMKTKNLDAIVANFYHSHHVPFGKRKITTAFIDRWGRMELLKNKTKQQVAARLLDWMKRV